MASFFKLASFLVFILLAACGKDGKAPSLSCSECKIFITDATYDGNLGGPDGADDKCMTDSNYPGDGQYKAMVTDFRNRSFELSDWVFEAEKEYYRVDGTLIGTTNNLAQLATLDNAASTTSANIWTGGDPIHCNFWRSNSSTHNGGYGDSGSTSAFGYSSNKTCDQVSRLVCVEQ